MYNIPFIDLKKQYLNYKKDIKRNLSKIIKTTSFIGGQVQELESILSEFIGVKHSIACSSGTDALVLALMALNIKNGDEVITTPYTFIATAEAISLVGATPVFVDIDPRTFNINSKLIEEKISKRTKAIMPVSLFGQLADMDEINKIAKKYNLFVIEDAAQSFGAEQNGIKSCNHSIVATTSFFPAKPLGCYGDGGAIFTNDDDLALKMRQLLNHGQTEKYVHKYIGLNGRLDGMQAAVLIAKMKYFKKEIMKRNLIAKLYSKELKGVTIPYVLENNLSVWAQYCVLTERRDELQAYLKKNGVPTMIYYPIPIHLQEAYSNLGHKNDDFPIAESISKKILALPMSAFLNPKHQKYIIEVLNEFN